MSWPGVLVYFSNSILLETITPSLIQKLPASLAWSRSTSEHLGNMVPPARICYTNPADTLCLKTAALQAWLQQQHLPKLYCQGSLDESSAGSSWDFEVLLSSTYMGISYLLGFYWPYVVGR